MRSIRLLSIFLLAAALSVGCVPDETGDLTLAAGSGVPDSPLRIMTYNVHMTPSPSDSSDDYQDQNGNQIKHHVKAQHIANSIITMGDIDVVVFNEAFVEDAQEAFVLALEPMFPHYVQFLDAPDIVPTSDSGLMLFSKHPFLDLEKDTFIAKDVIANNGSGLDGDGDPNLHWKQVAFVPFGEACHGILKDCVAAKGAGLVRIQHAVTQEVFSVAFTHMQADYSDPDPVVEAEEFAKAAAVRVTQLKMIEDMIRSTLHKSSLYGQRLFMLGDLNIDGNPFGSHPGEYASTFLSGFDFYSCAGGSPCPDPGASSERVLKDMWRFDTVGTDLGRTSGSEFLFGHDTPAELAAGKRLDYILRSRPEFEDELGPMCTQHMMIPWTIAGDGGDRSDHLPVLADINLSAPFCNPRAPRPIPFGPNFTGPDTLYFNDSDATITHPGSMQWYRLDEAAAYSFQLNGDPTGRVDVYHRTDLSRPVDDYYGVVTDYGLKYDLPDPPYYVRVSNSDTNATGNYSLSVHQHRCASVDDACPLRPKVEKEYPWPTMPMGSDNAIYYDFFTEMADSGAAPTLEFALDDNSANKYELILFDGYAPLTQYPPDSWASYDQSGNSIEASPIPLVAPNGPRRFIVQVKREGLAADTTRIRYTTNLTFFLPKRLRCDIRNDSWPDETDEIFAFFDVDTLHGDPTFMAESPPYSPYNKIGNFDGGTVSVTSFVNKIGLIRYLDHIVTNITEEDDGANGDNDYLYPKQGGLVVGQQLRALKPTDAAQDNATLTWEDESGSDADYRYRMRYRISHERLE